MKAEQPEKTHLEESARSETQLRSQGPLLVLPRLHVAHETNMADDRWNSYKDIFSNNYYSRRSIGCINPIISDDRL